MTHTVSIIGVGAFGTLMLQHIAPHFKVTLHDPHTPLTSLAQTHNATIAATPKDATHSDIIILAVPVQTLKSVCESIAPHLRPHQLVMDVASVKLLPEKIMTETLPQTIDLIGLHPLFGPQSGKNGIAGQNIALVNIRGNRAKCIHRHLVDTHKLTVIPCTAKEHDQDAAYVQGLTHMIGRVVKMMNLPPLKQQTQTFALLSEMVGLIKDDSDALFETIQTDNPFVAHTKDQFFKAVKTLEDTLKRGP